ncbi:MAG: transcriptional regulator MraZ [Proteobacteria bacterium]|nr:transcriptional regulator MraZ [Pseudomonadota bacterium]
MTTFLSSYTNSIDKKSRVSVPASFRAEIANGSRQTIVVYKAVNESFLFAWSYDDFLLFADKIKKLPALSKQRQRLSRTILAAAKPLQIDSDGRMNLPEEFANSLKLDGKVMFAGQGEYFTIWNPTDFEAQALDDMEFYDNDIDILNQQEELL